MKMATVTEAKNGLSALLDQVRSGETVLILDRGTPVAMLQPVSGQADSTGRIKRLQRAGVVRARATKPPSALLTRPGPSPAGGASAVDVLLEERRAGR
jgi:prevent-host-death family protein